MCPDTPVLRSSPDEHSADDPPRRSPAAGYKGSQELGLEEEFGCVETAKDSWRDVGKPQLAQPLIY